MVEWAIAGLFGLLIGSFLNVCIYRWPRDLSVVRPRSACVECGKPIAWYDNVPVLSYLILSGRCRQCGTRIHWRYPLVELITAICFAYFVHKSGMSLIAAKYCVFAAILIALVFCDLDMLILPDEFTIGGFAIGLVFAFFTPVPDTTFHLLASVFGWLPGPRLGMAGEALLGAIGRPGFRGREDAGNGGGLPGNSRGAVDDRAGGGRRVGGRAGVYKSDGEGRGELPAAVRIVSGSGGADSGDRGAERDRVVCAELELGQEI